MTEADEFKLLHTKHLSQLALEWGANRSNKDPQKEEYVLESLKPDSNVREICIRGHGGTACPTWLGLDPYVMDLESLKLDSLDWKTLPPLGDCWMVNEDGEEYQSCITGQRFQFLKRLELFGISLRKWRGNGTQLFPVLEILAVACCPELIELPLSQENKFPKLREIQISHCRKLSLPPFPWTNSLSSAEILQVSGIDSLNYKKRHQDKWLFVNMEKDAHDIGWNMLDFKNLSEIEELIVFDCPPIPLPCMQVLGSLKRLTIYDCSSFLFPVNNGCYTFPLEYLNLFMCGATGQDLTTFFSYFPGIIKLQIKKCDGVTGVGVIEEQAVATPAPSPTEHAHTGQHRQTQGRGEEEIKTSAEGLVLLPHQIQELDIESSPVRLCSSSLNGLASLRILRISGCRFLSSCLSSSSNCPFPNSLHVLYLSNIEGIFNLDPLSNLTELFIDECHDLRGKVLWPLLAQGHITKLTIRSCPAY